jgi:peptidoglycan/xylan/chitin deacetylase (PgdA/CDA1 family)
MTSSGRCLGSYWTTKRWQERAEPGLEFRRKTLIRITILPLAALFLIAAYWRTSTPSAGPDGQTHVAVASTPSSTPTPTFTLPPTPTPTSTATPTATPTFTPTPSATPTPTPTPTLIPTFTPLPTRTPTATPTFTLTPTPTPLQPTPDGIYRQAHVPILMYHYISDPPPGADAYRLDLSVSPAKFEEQLRYLRREGYESITLNDLALYLTVGQPLPPKPIILTFDDGYKDAYTHAFPLLQRYGFTGTFFLISGPIDAHNSEYLTWADVEEMAAAGMKFEPHSYDHPDLRNRGYNYVVFQVLAPKGAIEERTGETCRFFAYPSGRYDQLVIDVLRSANFWGAVLTEQGATHTADDLFTLRRVRVHGDGTLDDFIRTLNLDW